MSEILFGEFSDAENIPSSNTPKRVSPEKSKDSPAEAEQRHPKRQRQLSSSSSSSDSMDEEARAPSEANKRKTDLEKK